MKTAAIALACLLSVAATARAAEPGRALVPPFHTLQSDSPPDGNKPSLPSQISVEPARNKPPETPKPRVEAQPRPREDSKRRFEPPRGRVCFNAAETRDKIAAHHLAEPFRALRAGRLQGEALRAKLCRWKPDEFVYEVSVLRRDGRVMHVYMNAQNGQSVGALNDSDRH